MKKDRIALIDIDGTLANIQHRLHFIVAPYLDQFDDFKKDWHGFHEACIYDEPIEKMITLVNHMYENYEIILITGRMERNRQATIEWLAKHDLAFDHLYMRKDDDYRQDYVVKPGLLTEAEIKRTAFAIDDRNQVIDMWRDMGILALQCDEGDF